VAYGSGALDGFALTVWAPESAVCDWAAAETRTAGTSTAQTGTAAKGGTEKGRAENAATVQGATVESAAGRHDPEAGVTEAGVTEAGVTEAGVTEAGVTEAGIAGLRDDLRKRLSEPPDVLHARLSAVAGCLAAAETEVSSATVVGDGLADDGWVLVRAGGATIACAVVELSGISGPVAIAIMTGTPGQDMRQPVAAGRPRSQSRRQRGRASKHTG
jgi:hypothetical protein